MTTAVIIERVNCGISFFRGEAGATGITGALRLGEKSDAGGGGSLYNPRRARVGPRPPNERVT